MSLHDDAVATLDSWKPPTRAQDLLRERYLRHLRKHDDGVYRECRPDHLTASTLVLSRDCRQVLLTLHAKADRWFQFGGHCEPDDQTLAGAALREAVEESGLKDLVLQPLPLQLSEHPVPFCGPSGAVRPVHHLDVRYLAVVDADAAYAPSGESHEVRWWPTDALPDPDPAMLEMVELAIRSRR